MKTGPKPKPTLERLEDSYIPEPNSGCWLWIGSISRHGYGRICIGSRSDGSKKYVSAHRLAWQLLRGEIGGDLDICHKCDVRCCINPDHLFVGTHNDNMADAASKGRIHNRFQASKTHCPQGHPYIDSRVCLKCRREANRRHYARNAACILEKQKRSYWASPAAFRARALRSYYKRKARS